MNIKGRMIGILLAATSVAMAEMRTYTFQESGKTLEGEVVGFSGKAVTLRGADGKTVSIPIAYLTSSDRAYLAAEQSRQWKEVEVAKLDNAASTGHYKKCTVHGEGVSGEVFVEALPYSVETVLRDRNKQAAPIADLSARIDSEQKALQEAKSATPTRTPRNRVYRRALAAQRGQINVEMSNLQGLQAELAKLQKSYDESVKKTKAQTIVRMRNTGIMYKGLPVWECLDPRKAQR